MTHEQLVEKIQSGAPEYMPMLWDQIKNYIAWRARGYLRGYPDHYMQLLDDCINTSYFAVESAVKTYSSHCGKFTTYLKMPLVNAFREAIFCGRSDKQVADPANSAASLDDQVETNGEKMPLHEFIADKPQGVQTCYAVAPGIEAAELDDLMRSLHVFLERALKKDESAGSKILLYMLDNNCRYSEAIRVLYGDDAEKKRFRWQKNAAQRRLERYIRQNPIEADKHGVSEIIEAGGLRKYGLQPFRDRIFTSAVEHIAIERADRLN